MTDREGLNWKQRVEYAKVKKYGRNWNLETRIKMMVEAMKPLKESNKFFENIYYNKLARTGKSLSAQEVLDLC